MGSTHDKAQWRDQRNYKPLIDLGNLIQAMEYGSINFEVKKYDGVIKGIIAINDHSIKKGPNDERSDTEFYKDYLINQIDDTLAAGYKGSRTYTVTYDGKGGINRMQRQDYVSHSYETS